MGIGEIIAVIIIAIIVIALIALLVQDLFFSNPAIDDLKLRFRLTCAASDGCQNSLSYRTNKKHVRVFSGVEGVEPRNWRDNAEEVFSHSPDQTIGSLGGTITEGEEGGLRISHTLPHAAGDYHFGIEVRSGHLGNTITKFARKRVQYRVIGEDSGYDHPIGDSEQGETSGRGEFVLESLWSIASSRSQKPKVVACEVLELVSVNVMKVNVVYGIRSGRPDPDTPIVSRIFLALERGSQVVEDLGEVAVNSPVTLAHPVSVGPEEVPLQIRVRFVVTAEPAWPVFVSWTGAVVIHCPEKEP